MNEAEMSVIGCLLIDGELFETTQGYITEDDFQDPRCRLAYMVISTLRTQQMQTDIISVLNSMENAPDNKVFLMKCVEIVPTTSSYRQHVDIVKKASMARTVSYICTEALLAAEEDPIGAAGKVVERLSTVGETTGSTMDEAKEAYFRKMDGKSPAKLKTGFSWIDRCSGGLVPGEVTGIAARPGVGKTTLLLNILLNMHQQGNRVLFNSLEMSPEQIFDKVVAQRCGFPFERIRDGEVSLEESEEAKACIASLVGTKQFEIVYAPTIQKLTMEARRFKPDVIAIDYLQILQGNKRKSKYEEVSEISVGCKMMAKLLGIPVIAALQLNRQADQKAPKLSDLRDSGQIEQDLALCILLHRNTIGEDIKKTSVFVEKNRFGKTGAGELLFDGEKQRFLTVEARI